MKAVNLYGDQDVRVSNGHGIDIASQRMDDLDILSLSFIAERMESRLPVRAMDLGCGAAGHAIRMANAGAEVIAVDIIDQSIPSENIAKSGFEREISYRQLDMRKRLVNHFFNDFDLIVCQRTIHYLRFSEAVCAVRGMAELLLEDGKLFISASGLPSELSGGYPDKERCVTRRYANLDLRMQNKHGIYPPVCLYSEEDMVILAECAGMRAEKVWRSTFGNIKAVFRNA